ncbi:MAG: hypothetical protein LBJ74_04180 [Heliobacteriaceae bacterium]|jgi:hypothetical protein|nr:hypothetical protein [Heliobacteriaceae bacterium]
MGKIPRFLYHLTNKGNYQSILKDGVMKALPDDFFGNGVFMTELPNLFKRWSTKANWFGANLKEKLLEQAAKGSNEIVILKIPTSKLNKTKLKIRSQDKCFDWLRSDAEKCKSAEEFRSLFPEYKHIFEGDKALLAKLYKQRKESLEYIYPSDILISNVKKIGEVDVTALRATSEYDPSKPMRSIFTKLLEGTPEAKGAMLLKS